MSRMTNGAYDEYTLWEQIDAGAHYTPAKKWLTSVPIGLYVLPSRAMADWQIPHFDALYEIRFGSLWSQLCSARSGPLSQTAYREFADIKPELKISFIVSDSTSSLRPRLIRLDLPRQSSSACNDLFTLDLVDVSLQRIESTTDLARASVLAGFFLVQSYKNLYKTYCL